MRDVYRMDNQRPVKETVEELTKDLWVFSKRDSYCKNMKQAINIHHEVSTIKFSIIREQNP